VSVPEAREGWRLVWSSGSRCPCRRRCRARLSRIEVREGDLVRPGQQIAVLESMKMEHLVTAPHGGKVTKIAADGRRHPDAGRSDPVSRTGRDRCHDVTEEEDVDLITSVRISPS